MSKDRLIITAEQAEALLPDGEYVHNLVNPAGMLVGCDFGRDDAIAALQSAEQIEIGGEACRGMGHGLVVWADDKHSFFATDEASVKKLEAELLASH